MADCELGGFGGVVGAAEAKGSHELYEGRESGHGGGGQGQRRGQEEAGWGQP